VLRVLSDRVEDAQLQLSISVTPTSSIFDDGPLTTWLAELFTRHLRPVVANTVNFLHARDAQTGSGSLDLTLLLLERLTITVRLTVHQDRVSALLASRDLRLADLDTDPFKAFAVRWVAWCASPPARDLSLLLEYEHVYSALQSLMRDAGVTTPHARWETFRHHASGGALRLGPVSYEIPQDFWHRVNPDWAISELAEALLALRHRGLSGGLNRTRIKEALHLERFERDIGDAWMRYGQWLEDAPETRGEIETRLGTLLPF
jgi:hypothetical protein